jgi:hypothetical protein
VQLPGRGGVDATVDPDLGGVAAGPAPQEDPNTVKAGLSKAADSSVSLGIGGRVTSQR